jgi:hypothetical protein
MTRKGLLKKALQFNGFPCDESRWFKTLKTNCISWQDAVVVAQDWHYPSIAADGTLQSGDI